MFGNRGTTSTSAPAAATGSASRSHTISNSRSRPQMQSQYTRVKETPVEVDVNERDLELFHILNKDNPHIREEADFLKTKNAELRDHAPDVAIILDMKSKHLKTIKRYINNGITVGNAIMFFADSIKPYKWVLDALKDNITDVSNQIIEYIEPDYSMQDPSRHKGNRILVVSSNKPKNISGILQAFKVPEGIAGDIQELYAKGTIFDSASISMLINMADTYFKRKKAEIDASAFVFGEDEDGNGNGSSDNV
jgi:hypothetical protein